MSTSNVNPALAALYNNASSSTLPQTSQTASDLKSEFLQLLMTSLKNQDPTQPVDSTQMIAQQAQFASLEQMQNMNTNMVSMMAMQSVSQATSLIGHTVSGTVNGTAVNGSVIGISFQNGSPVLQVNTGGSTSTAMNLADVSTVF